VTRATALIIALVSVVYIAVTIWSATKVSYLT